MSTYVIDHECGHQITYNLAGRVKDREWRAERLRGQVDQLIGKLMPRKPGPPPPPPPPPKLRPKA